MCRRCFPTPGSDVPPPDECDFDCPARRTGALEWAVLHLVRNRRWDRVQFFALGYASASLAWWLL